MNKRVAMIPVRLGSSRVPRKNIRLLGGRPLVEYIVAAVIDSGVFSDIYINSEADIFAEIADSMGVKFYKRPVEYSTDSSTNDEFALDFMDNVPCDILFQLLATSPFITGEEIRSFVLEMEATRVKTMISVKNEQIEAIYQGQAINFNPCKPTPPSQFLTPVQPYACGLMAWDVDTFRYNMVNHGAAYHGGDASKGYFTLKGLATVDIDNEEDFQLAEVIAEMLRKDFRSAPRYYGDPGLTAVNG